MEKIFRTLCEAFATYIFSIINFHFQVIPVFKEQNPEGLLHVIELAGTARALGSVAQISNRADIDTLVQAIDDTQKTVSLAGDPHLATDTDQVVLSGGGLEGSTRLATAIESFRIETAD